MSKCFAVTTLLTAVLWGWSHARDVECAAAEAKVIRKSIRPQFSIPQENVRGATPFGADSSFRVDQLTYRDNQCRLLVKELGQEETTTVVSAEKWMSSQVIDFLRGNETTSKSDDGATRLLVQAWGDRSLWQNNGPEVTRARRNLYWRWTSGWVVTPFGYYVADDEDAEFLHEYYDEPEERVDYSTRKKFYIRLRKAFHAWFVTYPKEVWRRLTWKR